MIWTERKIIPPEELHIDVLDETFQHGLGLFETLRTWNGSPTLLPRHLERLQRSARDLDLPLRLEQLPGDDEVHKLIAKNQGSAPQLEGDVRIRITMSGGRGRSGFPLKRSTVWMTVGPLGTPAPDAAAIINECIQVALDDPLARYKTLNYWRKRIAWARAFEAGAHEVLCVTADGLVCEGTRSNVFLVRDRRLCTPGTDGPLLPGIMRRVVLEHAGRLGLTVFEGWVPIDALATADEAFLTSSVMGMLPVGRLLGRDLPAPGPVTQRLWSSVLPWLESGGNSP
ncbi:MAG TPA: aminotransferase class IV [Isosphaeraceae bacterium]|nr:aminotransferase class IV [Isosphaeraceae bacterium]